MIARMQVQQFEILVVLNQSIHELQNLTWGKFSSNSPSCNSNLSCSFDASDEALSDAQLLAISLALGRHALPSLYRTQYQIITARH